MKITPSGPVFVSVTANRLAGLDGVCRHQVLPGWLFLGFLTDIRFLKESLVN
jgi:hypothetical protein